MRVLFANISRNLDIFLYNFKVFFTLFFFLIFSFLKLMVPGVAGSMVSATAHVERDSRQELGHATTQLRSVLATFALEKMELLGHYLRPMNSLARHGAALVRKSYPCLLTVFDC